MMVPKPGIEGKPQKKKPKAGFRRVTGRWPNTFVDGNITLECQLQAKLINYPCVCTLETQL